MKLIVLLFIIVLVCVVQSVYVDEFSDIQATPFAEKRNLRGLKFDTESVNPEMEDLILSENALSEEQRKVLLTKRVSAAMIFDEEKYGRSDHDRKAANSRTFMQTLLRDNGLDVTVDLQVMEGESAYDASADPDNLSFVAWPGVFTGECPGVGAVERGGKAKGMDRGLLIAHREIWDHHIKGHEQNEQRRKLREGDDVVVVFEDDPYPTTPHHQLNTFRELNRMHSDVHWLGWCYYDDAPEHSPLCMHAYVVSVKGARDLLAGTETCGPQPLDRQVRAMCDAPSVRWSMTTNPVMKVHGPSSPAADRFRGVMAAQGIHVPEVIHYGGYGGVFAQAEFDTAAQHDPNLGENQLVKVIGSKSVFLWKNSQAHPFDSGEEFEAMGFSFDRIYHISPWKFSTMSQGAAVTAELCKQDGCGV
jgi:hypothetical protein